MAKPSRELCCSETCTLAPDQRIFWRPASNDSISGLFGSNLFQKHSILEFSFSKDGAGTAAIPQSRLGNCTWPVQVYTT